MIIALSFLTVGVFLSLSNNIRHLAGELSSKTTASFFLFKDIAAPDLDRIREAAARSPLVAETIFVDSEEALARFKASFPDLRDILTQLQKNPFPPSLEIRLKDGASPEAAVLIRQLRAMKGVEDVQFNKEWVDRMESFSRLAKAVGYFLGGILVLASFFIISNIVKLNVLARKNEIEILRLVGATNAFIRVPFLLEGMALGALGGLLSLAVLFLLIRLFPLSMGITGFLRELLNFRYLTFSQAAALVVSGAVIGLLGSAGSVSRFIKT